MTSPAITLLPESYKPMTPRQPARPLAAILLLGLALLALAAGCKSDQPPDAWKTVSLEDHPPVFEMRQGHPALARLEGLHLTQSHDAAVAALKKHYCPHPVRKDGRMGDDAYFLGCRLQDHPTLQFIRVGFWPSIDDRVATLEFKRKSLPPAVVHRRFQALNLEPTNQHYQQRLIQIATKDYRLLADWDEGLEGPAHIIVGLAPDFQP